MDALQELVEELQGNLHVEQVGLQQYKLMLPSDVFKKVQKEAKKRGMHASDLIRLFITLGLALISEIEPGAKLIIEKEGKRDRQLIIPF